MDSWRIKQLIDGLPTRHDFTVTKRNSFNMNKSPTIIKRKILWGNVMVDSVLVIPSDIVEITSGNLVLAIPEHERLE